AVEAAVEGHAADFQAFLGGLIEQNANDVVGLLLGGKRTQCHRVAATLVEQDGGGVAEEPLGSLLLRPADHVRGALAVIGLVVDVNAQQPVSPPIQARETEYVMQGA